MESAAFVMHEASERADDSLIAAGAEDDRLFAGLRGWDKKYGGLLYFVDVDGKPPTRLEWDMKLWWPHAEALYALLLAYAFKRR